MDMVTEAEHSPGGYVLWVDYEAASTESGETNSNR